MLIVHLFVSYAHVNLCHFFSSSLYLGLAAISACGSSWAFLFTFFKSKRAFSRIYIHNDPSREERKQSQNMKVIIDALKTGRSNRLVIGSRVIITSEQNEKSLRGQMIEGAIVTDVIIDLKYEL